MALGISKRDIDIFLAYLYERLEQGDMLEESIERYYNGYLKSNPFMKKAVGKILDVADMGGNVFDEMYRQGLIKQFDLQLIKTNTNPVLGLKVMLENKESAKSSYAPLIWALVYIIHIPMTFLWIGMGGGDDIMEYISVMAQGKEITLPWLFANKGFSLIIGYVTGGLLVALLVFLFWSYSYNTKLHFAINPMQELALARSVIQPLTALVKAGNTLADSIEKLEAEVKHPQIKEMLWHIIDDMNKGSLRLVYWLERYGFGMEVTEKISLIDSGGNIVSNLDKALLQIENREKYHREVTLQLVKEGSKWGTIGILGGVMFLVGLTMLDSFTGYGG